MKVALADIETDGLWTKRPNSNGQVPKRATVIHCICVRALGTTDTRRFYNRPSADGSIEDGLAYLATFDRLVFHNGDRFDIPVIRALYPSWEWDGESYDTLVMSHLIFPYIGTADWKLVNAGILPRELLGWHSVKAWGHRLSCEKGEFGNDPDRFDTLTREMVDYCEQDVAVLEKIYIFLIAQRWAPESTELEHKFALTIFRMEENGVGFDMEAAEKLCGRLLTIRAELEPQLSEALGTRVEPTRLDERTDDGQLLIDPRCYGKDVQYDAGSREQVARALVDKFGWVPDEDDYTEQHRPWGRVPKLGEEQIEKIPDDIPFKGLLVDWFTARQRLGMLAEGKTNYMSSALEESRGRYVIRGRVNHNGARTGRCTHSKPNMNVPRVTSKYGAEMRACFIPTQRNWVMVGADLSRGDALILAHYLLPYDGGRYAKMLESGDFHESNRVAAGLDNRDTAKNCLYARTYDAKVAMIQTIVTKGEGKPCSLERAEFIWKVFTIVGLEQLTAALDKCYAAQGWFFGLDGRRLVPKKKSAILPTLISAGLGVVMKRATVIAYERLDLEVGRDSWAPMLHVHDEYQVECEAHVADLVAKILREAMVAGAVRAGVNVPMGADSKIGANWAETH